MRASPDDPSSLRALHAVDEGGASEGLPYGAPEEDNATAAFRFLISGAADTGGPGDAGRGLVGVLLLLGAVALGGFVRRRMLV